MQSPAECRQRGFLRRLGQSRMRVDGDADVVRRGAILESQNNLGDELRNVGADEMSAEQLVRARVRDELNEARILAHGAGTTVRAERKPADAILAATLLDLSLGETDRGDLGPGVDDVGDGLV